MDAESGLKHWLALSRVKGIGRFPVSGILERFGALETVFAGSSAALGAYSTEFAASIKAFGDWDWVDREIALVKEAGARVVPFDDPEYPPLLREIPDAPALLYMKGRRSDYGAPVVAIVGTRRPTHYGLKVSETLARDLASAGVTIASGMARGCDTCAHRGALFAGGRTVAVLGTGVDVPYPGENAKLYNEIIEKGLVVSEYPMGTPPVGYNFPKRNRIISGVSDGVVVVEAPLRSGALMTARLSLDYNREVLAVPGQMTSGRSAGTNRLIREGAAIVTSVDDIFEALSITIAPEEDNDAQKGKREIAGDELLIWKALKDESLHIDDIAGMTSLSAAKTSALLLQMELKGLVRQEPGKRFLKR
ncbi:MAG: DNA-protecting protein DprA [Deltaproteobacteria bacterium]|nr:DNA-protecting protein DprA [Deltaproteobacteria bacterium]